MSEYEVTKVNLPKFPPPELIVLTLEEAKNIVETLDLLCEFVNINTDFVSDLFLDGCSTMKILDDRIKQVEGK